MRYLIIVIGIAVVIAGFAQTKPTIKAIEFSKSTRGFEQRINLTPDSLHTWIDGRRDDKLPFSSNRRLTGDEWTSLVQTTQQLNLKEFGSLPSPTMKRASDAAMHSTITITTSDGKSYSHGFDDENPHIQVIPLMKKIIEVSGVDRH